MRRIAVVLVRPSEEGNVGSAARAMANMGLEELILVEPAVDLGATARAFAVGAGHVLDRALRAASLEEALAPFRRIVGTTSARDRVPRGRLIEPRRLAERFAADPESAAAALVFGPERSGLANAELALASPVVRIPASPRQPTLNLGQAVLVVAYELFVAGVTGRSRERRGDTIEAGPEPEPPASAGELAGLHGHLDRVLRASGFARDDTAAAVLEDLRRFLARAGPTSREVVLARGICRRILNALERSRGGDKLPAP